MSYVITSNVIIDGVARKLHSLNTGYSIYTEPVIQDVSLPAFFIGTPLGFGKSDHPANRMNLTFPVTIAFEVDPEPIITQRFSLYRDIYDLLEYNFSEMITVFPDDYTGTSGIYLRTKDFKGTMNSDELVVDFAVMCRVKQYSEDLVAINSVETNYSLHNGG